MEQKMNAKELNEKLLVTENALAELSEEELETLLTEIGYGGKAAELLINYQTLVKAFRKKIKTL